jgi:nucleotide-binding universal stress UspA family protein
MKFSKILFPMNINQFGGEYLKEILLFVEQAEAELHILHVSELPPLIPLHEPLTTIEKFSDNISPELLQEKIETEYPPIKRYSYKKTYATRFGDVSSEVSEYCDELNIDLIITLHHTHNSLYEFLFHSTDERIIEKVNKPVLVLPMPLP